MNRVMVFDARGIYPRGTLRVPNGFFHADDVIAFSVVLGESWEEHDPDLPYSEFDWASPQELRLIASLILCEIMDGGYIALYPFVHFSPQLAAAHLDLASDHAVNDVRAWLLTSMDEEPSIRNNFSPLRQHRGATYQLTDPTNFALDRLGAFWSALASQNYVLLRGVYALMKSDMLRVHAEFYEEAVTAVYVALEASFSLVLRALRASGNPSPSAKDAAEWVHMNFNAPFGLPASNETYFQEFYEGRVMALHPASRFGDTPYAPLMHDDLCHLRPWLRQLFAYLILGEHDPGFVSAVQEHRRFHR